MKRNLSLLLILFLAACAPAAPVVPTSTAIPAASTNPATDTPAVVEPTATALPPTATASPARVDFDYAIIPGSETVTDIGGYPVSIALHPSMSSKFSDLEFSDTKPIANQILNAYYEECLGHKPEAEGKTLAEFKDLVAKAKAGDQAALEAITYQTWRNDMDDDKGYKPMLVTVSPLFGGGWTENGVLRPNKTIVLVVDTRKVSNISPQFDMGSGFGFNVMEIDGEVVDLFYIGGARDGLDWSKAELNLANEFVKLSVMAKNNNGSLEYGAGKPLTDLDKNNRSELMDVMELKK